MTRAADFRVDTNQCEGGDSMQTKPFLIAAMLMALAMPAFAQAPQGTPTNVRGKIAKVTAQTLTVKTREGPTVDIALAPNASVRTLVRKKLSDIHNGDLVGITNIQKKDGKLHAIEIHFLPPVAPESQNPYDLVPGSIMTNAHVSGVATVKGSNTLTVSVKGTPTDIVVDKKTAIVGPSPTPATMADLKPGKAVSIRAVKAADGTLSANNVTVEKNGVKPPM
jgi:hypothetical protein